MPMKTLKDICYKKVDGIALHLDLYLPTDPMYSSPLIMWIHGGGWEEGDRKTPMLLWMVAQGYALASIDYRLSGQACFPSQIIDCKDALVYLRTHAEEYNIDPKRIAVAGDSAGGHLAALMGTSAGHADWEPEGADCSVQAVVDFYGPTALGRNWPNSVKPGSCESKLLGVPVATPQGMARAACASPLTYIDGTEPPFLIIHGDADDVVPFEQSVYLRNALEAVGAPVALHRVWQGGHGFPEIVYKFEVSPFLSTMITHNH